MMPMYLRAQVAKAGEARLARLEALSTQDDILAYQDRVRTFFLERLGGFPERTPLNARVAGTLEGDGFRVEKVLFDSRPGFPVTAALFLPQSEPPHPAVLVPCGHSENGKASEAYQQVCIFLARNGMAALVYDPIGQGERKQLLDGSGKSRFGSTLEHTLVGVGCILLGTNTATFRIWDGMRAIDYLCSREDIDPKRIGCTGNSGGGTLTSYIMALDERVKCAAPSCYLTSLPRLCDVAGPQDAEQNIAGQIAFGMDHGDYVILRAPRPTLICAATFDFFDIVGTWGTFREAKRVYTKLGFPECVSLVEAPEKHGFTPPLRQGAVRWMRRWLMGIDDAVIEQDTTVFPEEELRCTPEGQVLLTEGARSAFDINAEQADAAAEARESLWEDTPLDQLLARVREVARVRPLTELPEPVIELGDSADMDGYRVQRITLRPENEIILPAVLLLPAEPRSEAYLYVHGEGKTAAREAAVGLAKQGYMVLVPDLRGVGETQCTWGIKGWEDSFGPDWQATFLAYLLDKPVLAMRAEDILVCARFLKSYEGSSRPLHLIAVGHLGPAALHAGALEPDLFDSVALEHSLASWDDVVRTPLAKQQLVNAVHGALRVYDLPDLAKALGGKLTVTSPVNALGEPIVQ